MNIEIVGHVRVSFPCHDMYLVDFDYVTGDASGSVSQYVSGQMWDSHLAGEPVVIDLVRGFLAGDNAY